MLSKVLGRSDTDSSGEVIRACVFPSVQPNIGRPSSSGLLPQGQPRADSRETAELLEKLRVLEARLVSEPRDAFEAGRTAGEKQARLDLQPVIERLTASTSDILDLRSDLRRRAEKDVVHLALLIAKRVLHRQLAVDEGALTAIARIAFERLTRSESYRVTVNPQFAAAVSSALPGNHASRVQIDPDPSCALGTLIIHSTEGTIDASIDAQLEEISRGLTDRLAQS